MSGFDNDTVYANNADFSRAGAGGGSAANGLQLNGQLWIGSTAVNVGGTHVNVGVLTSNSGTLTIANGPGTINLEVTGGTTTIQTLTGNSGGALSPTAGNINTLGSGSITISGSGSTLTTALSGLTNHALLVGGGTATISKVATTATAGQVLQSAGAAADPAYSTATYPATATSTGTVLRADGTNWSATTATYPATTTISQLLYSSANNVIGGLTTANNGLLVTSATGVPSILAGPGTSGNILQSNSSAAPSFSTATFPVSTTINQVLYSSSANVVGGITAANNGTMISGTTGIPSWLANGTTGQLLTATTGSPPSWVSPATSGTVTTVSVATANGFAGTVANATTTPAITLTTSQTGLLSGNGTAITGTAITQYNVITGGASNAPNSVAPSATSGIPLVSNGSSSQPSFTTAVVAGGGTGNTTFTAYSVICAGTSATGVFQNVSGLGSTGNVLTSNGAGALPTWQAAGGSGGGKVTAQRFTATGAYTYTPTANMVTCIINMVGGGGGGGGVAVSSGTNSAASGGGAGGSYLSIYATAAQIAAATVTGSVGIAGTAGTAGNNNGGNGGNTTIVINSSTWTAAGGNGGTGSANQASPNTTAGGTAVANTTGSNATLIDNITGAAGKAGVQAPAFNYAFGGDGGDSGGPFGKGGAGSLTPVTGTAVGVAASGFGGGGGGSGGWNSASNVAGAAGTQGYVEVIEFLSG